MSKKMRIGFVGCGAISGIYFDNLLNMFKEVEIAGVCDLIDERAERAATDRGVHRYKDMHEMFADPSVDIVLNITRPYEHIDVSLAAIAAGKHVYTEKPLGASFEEGTKIRDAAAAKGVRIGGAPDTFLGAGIQTCRRLIDDGYIGTPVGASAFMVCRGHESWHPDPEFYYKYGGGPMMDMGPYYITALVNLLGGIKAVSGMAKASFPTRTITSQPHYGTVVNVDVPTYITGMMQFQNGAVGTIFTTFDVCAANVPIIEIYGSEGTLSVPDPNGFGGPIRIRRREVREAMDFPITFDYAKNSRGLGLADMAKAIQTGRDHRANGELTYHVLEVLTGFERAAKEGKQLTIASPFTRTAPMVNGSMVGILD